MQNHMLAPPRELAPHFGEILDPPLINPAFKHEMIGMWQNNQRNFVLSGTSNKPITELTVPDL